MMAQGEVTLSLEEKDNTPLLREKESNLIKIIEALQNVSSTEDWSTLKTLVFDSRIDSLKKQLESESQKLVLNDSVIYRLQGKLYEAKKYDLDNLVETYRIELSNIKKRIITQPTERFTAHDTKYE